MLTGSTNSLTPFDSKTWSPAPPPSSIIRPSWKPEQPPPCTNTRRPLPALFSSVSSSLILDAAISDTLIIEISPQIPHHYTIAIPMTLAAPIDTRDGRMAHAERRWRALLAARPDLKPAISLQRQLIGLVVDLTEVVERARLPRLSLPPRYVAAKLARGVPALAGEPIPLPVAMLTPALIQLCEELAKGGAADAADHIRTAIAESRMESGSLLTASFQRDHTTIRTGAEQRGLSPDLVWLVAELAVSPYAYVL